MVGGGPAGVTANLYLARANYRVLVLEKEQFGGQIIITHEVVNFSGIEKTSGKHLTDIIRSRWNATLEAKIRPNCKGGFFRGIRNIPQLCSENGKFHDYAQKQQMQSQEVLQQEMNGQSI